MSADPSLAFKAHGTPREPRMVLLLARALDRAAWVLDPEGVPEPIRDLRGVVLEARTAVEWDYTLPNGILEALRWAELTRHEGPAAVLLACWCELGRILMGWDQPKVRGRWVRDAAGRLQREGHALRAPRCRICGRNQARAPGGELCTGDCGGGEPGTDEEPPSTEAWFAYQDELPWLGPFANEAEARRTAEVLWEPSEENPTALVLKSYKWPKARQLLAKLRLGEIDDAWRDVWGVTGELEVPNLPRGAQAPKPAVPPETRPRWHTATDDEIPF